MPTHAHKRSPAVEGGAEDLETAREVETVAGERSRLLARKHSGQKLSSGEQDRLALLTARLEELLPPVSIRDLEALLEMAEEVEGIRERARERRQRLAG